MISPHLRDSVRAAIIHDPATDAWPRSARRSRPRTVTPAPGFVPAAAEHARRYVIPPLSGASPPLARRRADRNTRHTALPAGPAGRSLRNQATDRHLPAIYLASTSRRPRAATGRRPVPRPRRHPVPQQRRCTVSDRWHQAVPAAAVRAGNSDRFGRSRSSPGPSFNPQLPAGSPDR